MAKRPPIGKCVHCLTESVDRTWDHVFPRAWYPDTTPQDIYKWQIPSCNKCNRDYGELENDLLFRFALSVDPKADGTSGIVEKALRSIKPEFAKTDRDKKARITRMKRIKRELLDGADIPQSAIYPGLGERWGRPTQQSTGILISADSIRRLAEKIVRGIYYLEDKKFIEPPYKIQFYALSDEGAKPVKDILDRFGAIYAREPGIIVRRAIPVDAPMNGIFEIDVWGQFKMYASIDV